MAWDNIPEWSAEVAQEILSSVKEKDPFTYFHCARVGRGSRKLAKAIGLNEFEQAVLEFSGLFHDIGKVKIPHEILVKPGRLEKPEIEVMKAHPQLSAGMIEHLANVPFFRFLLPGIKYHHERFDGEGYPFNMRAEGIPLFARLIAVVDAYDAMTNARPYRNPLPEEKVIQEIKEFSGRQFDDRLARYFLEYLPHMKKEIEKEEQNDIIVSRLIKAA
jgi:HD-GYP domain-containing protein (c-di-GMP phosphodiesterase class II)